MHAEPFYPGDLNRIEPQEFQKEVDLTRWSSSPGWKVVDENLRIHSIFLLPEIAPGRVAAFTVFSRYMTAESLKFSAREALRFLYEWGEFRRCEAYVLEGAEHEIRWCWKVLGMTLEGKLRAFAPDGRACYIFSVVKE